MVPRLAVPKAGKETRSVERKFASLQGPAAGVLGRGCVGGRASVQQPAPLTARGQEPWQNREGPRRNSTASSDRPLEVGRRWPDHRHLRCFRCSSSSVPSSACVHLSKASPGDRGSWCPGYGPVITQLASPPGRGFSVYRQRAHGLWPQHLRRSDA